MTKTIFITGASSGIGKATAKHFHEKGWNVVATMRNPIDSINSKDLANIPVARLDVTESASISAAVSETVDRFGAIDVLLNNAGYGAYGPLESFDMDRIRRQFDTNVIGLPEVTKAVLPHMRARKSGTIVNISSIGGQITFPLGTLYHGTKFAVEGLSEALHYELAAIGIKVKIVEPGMVATDFGGRSFDFANDPAIEEYQGIVSAVMSSMGNQVFPPSPPELIAEVIWNAVTDGSEKLRYRAGQDAEFLLAGRKDSDDATFIEGIKEQMGL